MIKTIESIHMKRIQRTLALCMQIPTDQVFRLGCMIFNSSRCAPVGTGVNAMTKTHPKADQVYGYPFPHAELMATLGVSREKLQGSVAYVARRRKGDGLPAQAKPCDCCMAYLQSQGIKKVYYTTDEGVGFIDLR